MPILKALIAALAFGLSAPLAKLLLAVVPPLFLAGLLYLGAGVFLGLTRLVWRRRPRVGRPLTPRDRGILAALVLVGGVLAPPLLLWGLARSPATETALLLNLEVVFTALLAGLVFGEHLGPRVAIAAAGMALGAVSSGTSLVLFILAMRDLGAARAGAYFAAAPFFGAAGGLALGERPTPGLFVAAALMAGATWLLVHERHSHRHRHEGSTHS